MSRFFVEPNQITEDRIVLTNPVDLHHMTKVLRLKVGDAIEVSDSSRWEYRAELTLLEKDRAEARILDKQSFSREPAIQVTLFQGIPKQGKMETIIQKTVELGIGNIVPVFMARTVVTDKGNFGKKLQRWQKVADEAVKQCKRGVIPPVEDAVKTRDMIQRFRAFDLVLFPYENEGDTTIKEVLRRAYDGAGERPRRVALIIGPEGGFSQEEAAEIVEAGGIAVSLGKTTLRTETAGMAALAMVMYEGEL